MKKTALSIIFICFTFSLFSQLEVFTNGNVGINTSSALSNLSVNTAGLSKFTGYFYNTAGTNAGMFYLNYPTATGTNYNISLYANVGNMDVGKNIAGKFSAYKTSGSHEGHAYGVYGQAGNGKIGYNVGVLGILHGTRNGAGIVGTYNGEPDYIDGKYSGYFIGGDLKVYGSDILVVDGVVKVDGVEITSDIRLKTNVESLRSTSGSSDNLNKIQALEAIKYNIIDRNTLNEPIVLDTGNVSAVSRAHFEKDRFGFSAQELQAVIPELIGEDKEGFLSIDYIGLIPILVEAMKEQQTFIEGLQSDIDELENLLTQIEYKKSLATGVNDNDKPTEAFLFQNLPNPFSSTTIIRYVLPEVSINASIMICDMNGKQIKTIQLVNTGESNITIESNELQSGMFMYTMIVDDQIIDTKQMILTD